MHGGYKVEIGSKPSDLYKKITITATPSSDDKEILPYKPREIIYPDPNLGGYLPEILGPTDDPYTPDDPYTHSGGFIGGESNVYSYAIIPIAF